MNFLILFLLTLTISISKIRGDKHCAEQKCGSELSEWCCPYNTTCANQNTCNTIKKASKFICSGDNKCSFGEYYWCCDNDQTCGSFRKCNERSLSDTAIIVIACTIGPTMLLSICICYIRWRRLRNNINSRIIYQPSDNQGLEASVYVLTNDLATQENLDGQAYNIRTRCPTAFNREEPPPTYEAAMASSTTQNQNKI